MTPKTKDTKDKVPRGNKVKSFTLYDYSKELCAV
jgi:hypothetical protein